MSNLHKKANCLQEKRRSINQSEVHKDKEKRRSNKIQNCCEEVVRTLSLGTTHGYSEQATHNREQRAPMPGHRKTRHPGGLLVSRIESYMFQNTNECFKTQRVFQNTNEWVFKNKDTQGGYSWVGLRVLFQTQMSLSKIRICVFKTQSCDSVSLTLIHTTSLLRLRSKHICFSKPAFGLLWNTHLCF